MAAYITGNSDHVLVSQSARSGQVSKVDFYDGLNRTTAFFCLGDIEHGKVCQCAR
jgi:hypothetical protein